MLVLTRRPNEEIRIGGAIRVTVCGVEGAKVRIGIDAPVDVLIYRGELYEDVLLNGSRRQARALDQNAEQTVAAS